MDSGRVHPDDIPRPLTELPDYLHERYGLRVSYWRLWNWARAGKLPVSRVGHLHSTPSAVLRLLTPSESVG